MSALAFKKLTQAEAVLWVLESTGLALTRHEILAILTDKDLCEFGGNTPSQTVSRILSTTVKNAPTRLRRVDKARYLALKPQTDPFLFNAEDQNIQLLLDNDFLPKTEKERLVKVRLGQYLFRKKLDEFWHGSCALTGFKQRQALRASHIIPWREKASYRLDPDNGLLLRADIDALFDSYLISFTSAGELLLARQLEREDRKMLPREGTLLRHRLNEKQKIYLEEHCYHFLR
ncbi:hypothetical protein FAI41_05940 [Acetobacteraceae bacterium]|nr:hypothetical protein FAI41_05940 [Acetobacteraceae bacterium]